MKKDIEFKKEIVPVIKSGFIAASKGLLSELPGTGVFIESMNEAAYRKIARQVDFLNTAYDTHARQINELGELLKNNTTMADYWHETSELASRASNADKQALFVGILYDVSNKSISLSTAELFRKLVANLSSDHVKIISVMKAHQEKHPKLNIGGIPGFPGISTSEISAAINPDKHTLSILIGDLERSKLISNVNQHMFTGYERTDRYKLTEFGVEFISSIQSGSN